MHNHLLFYNKDDASKVLYTFNYYDSSISYSDYNTQFEPTKERFHYDFNLDYYDDVTYNEIDSLPDADPKKIFYLFTSKNNDKYYGLYKNSKLGQMLVRRMEMMIENFDAIFYYDKDKFNEQVAKEVGFEEGRNEGIAIGLDKGKTEEKKEIILRMLNAGVSDSDIIKYSSVTKSELNNIKKSIGK